MRKERNAYPVNIYRLYQARGAAGDRGGPRGLKPVEGDVAATDKRLPPYFWAAFVLSGDWR